jgi:hypothetical protein
MKTKIVDKKDGIEIQVAEAASHTVELMAAFKECQEGRCSCPTQEYEKVESLSVKQSQAGITLRVKSKKGKKIDVGEIEKCLEHTKNRIE